MSNMPIAWVEALARPAFPPPLPTWTSNAKLANHAAKSADRKPANHPAELARVRNLANLPGG